MSVDWFEDKLDSPNIVVNLHTDKRRNESG